MDKKKIIYNDRDIRSSRVNVTRVTAVREEIGLLLGISESGAGNEADVKLTNRIILNPFAAKRLAVVLEDAIRAYEVKYGDIGQESKSAPAQGTASLSFSPVPARPEITDEKASRLFNLVKGLDVQIGIERSFKFFEGKILPDRFLIALKRDQVPGDCNARILDVCSRMDMPLKFLEVFRDNIQDANIVLFGFEGEGEKRLYKTYLEFGSRFNEVTHCNLKPFLIHQGFKWDTDDNSRCARTDYTCFPLFTAGEIMERVRGIYHPGLGNIPSEIAESFLKAAREKVDGFHEMLYLEAGEKDNPRTSFDLNIYRSNIRMTALYPLFEMICRYYSIPLGRFNALYEPVKKRIFGHISGGIDRHGRDFMTIYFGIKGSTWVPGIKS